MEPNEATLSLRCLDRGQCGRAELWRWRVVSFPACAVSQAV